MTAQFSAKKPTAINEPCKTRVLIADDNEINVLLMANLLEMQGCIVDSAVNGKDALALINQNNYKFALIDLNMPVMTGIELATILKSQQNSIKLVAISAYVNDNTISKILAAGFDSFLTKPVEEEPLIALINL
jgi:CheY-like chemotaxis protein